jgi:hypothetical protein
MLRGPIHPEGWFGGVILFWKKKKKSSHEPWSIKILLILELNLGKL